MDRGVGVLLETRQPLDLALTLEGGQAFRWRREGAWYHGVLGSQALRLRKCPQGIEFHVLSLGAASPQTGASSLGEATLKERLWRYFRFDDDLEAICRELSQDASVAKAVNACWGLRLLRQDPWECLASFICSIDSNIPRIIGTVERLAQAFGESITTTHGKTYAFPTPQALAEAPMQSGALRRLGLGFRAPYLWQTAQRVTQGDVDLEGLCALPYAEAKRQLLTLPGVGDKVADCVLAFSLDKLEAFPIDRWVRRALEEEYLGGQRLPDRALRQWTQEHFGTLGSYAQQYLFQWRRGIERSGSGG